MSASNSYGTVVLCLLLAGCGKEPTQPVEFGGGTATVLCERFGGLKEASFEDSRTPTRRRITYKADCNDGSSVWRWTGER